MSRHFGNVAWYTNLPIKKGTEPLELTKEYYPALYPEYDNYGAIEVSRVKDIPKDYDGLMGVPVSFLDKYNPEQFDLVGMDWVELGPGKRFYINGKRKFARLLIKRK